MGQRQVEVEGQSPEQQQRDVLGPNERRIGSFQRQVGKLLGSVPLGYAQTPLGERLVDILNAVVDDLTNTRTVIRGEIGPVATKEPKPSAKG